MYLISKEKVVELVKVLDARLGYPDGKCDREVFVLEANGYGNEQNKTYFFTRNGSPNKMTGFIRNMNTLPIRVVTNYGVFQILTRSNFNDQKALVEEIYHITGPRKAKRLD